MLPPAGNMSSHKGLNGTCSVHEYTGTFASQSVRFKMTSVCGHVMTLDFLGEPPTPCPPIPLREALHGASQGPVGTRGGIQAEVSKPTSPDASRLEKSPRVSG